MKKKGNSFPIIHNNDYITQGHHTALLSSRGKLLNILFFRWPEKRAENNCDCRTSTRLVIVNRFLFQM
jgi:hypothetical protein